MAKSKAGGTRAYIRGKIGADVYSIGKDGKGRKQQVVRSLAEQVKNPQTTAQMRGRMIMSTIMQVVAQMSQLVDHSFDNVPTGQPSISEFIRRNYALIKKDVADHPSSGNTFGLNKYQEKGAKGGAYVIAAGTAQLASGVELAADEPIIGVTAATMTAGGVRAALGLGAEDYLTLVSFDNANGVLYTRLRVDFDTLADATTITGSNADKLFTVEGNSAPTFSVAGNVLSIAQDDTTLGLCQGLILSKKSGASYIHNDAVMSVDDSQFSESVALPTYPTGTERFLNGGEI